MNWRARGGAGHCVGRSILTFWPLSHKKVISLSSLSTLKPHILFLLLAAAASSRWHTVAFSYIPAESGVTNEIRIGRFPSHTGGPHFAISAKIDEGTFWIKCLHRCSGRVGREILLPRLPTLHTSWSTHKLWNPKGKIQAKKANALFNNRKEERKRERKRRGFPIDFRMEQPKYGRKKKEF